ncbi:hypothetical protein AB0H86_04985 [Streptomyces sp. NPDC050997]|uniref:hypothetical protein n=1 Tax=Streptomyces sp. NPDC050997 TaxID=3155519 RepID=UPI00343EE42D
MACPAAGVGCVIDDVARCTDDVADDVARWTWDAGGATGDVPCVADDVPCGVGAPDGWAAGVD